jgi:hypothetical protein
VEAGLKFEILDGILDGVDEVEDIYASHELSSIVNHFPPGKIFVILSSWCN